MNEQLCQESINKYYNIAFKKGFESARTLDLLIGFLAILFLNSVVVFQIANYKDMKDFKIASKSIGKTSGTVIFLLAIAKGVQTLIWWF
ncbi:MAG: hypothetical protein ACLFUH_04010 [Bacteroidales bacterium]